MRATVRRWGWESAGVRGIIPGLALAAALAWGATFAGAAPGPPTNDEIALVALANQARSDPAALGYPNPVVPPLLWNDALGAAARAHSDDMALNGFFRHESSNGETFLKRVSRYYPGWTSVGESIIGALDTPQQMHAGWLSSPGHRANILSGSFTELGAGIAFGQDGWGPLTLATENFGSRGLWPLNSLPTLPAGAVLPRLGGGEARQLLVNFYHYRGGDPEAVRAIVGSSCVALSRVSGTPTHGTYGAARSFSGNGCVPLVFEAVRSDGARYRFPQSEAILVGVGAAGAGCAERTTQVPTTDCGGGPLPTPTPDPGPGGEARLGNVRIALRPSRARASKGSVSISATLSTLGSFDPSGSEVRIAVGLANGSGWSKALPAFCEGSPCMQGNAKRTVYRMRSGAIGPQLTFSRTRDGDWRMRFWSRSETLGDLAAGPVTLAVEAGHLTAAATVDGEMREIGLVAE